MARLRSSRSRLDDLNRGIAQRTTTFLSLLLCITWRSLHLVPILPLVWMLQRQRVSFTVYCRPGSSLLPLGIVGQDADDELRARVRARDLVQLVGVVERHDVDARAGGAADERCRLAGVGEDDAVGADADVEHLLDLVVRRAVEIGPEGGEEPKNVRVRVALDG